MINVLCFGDSNTNGSNPAGGRHPRDVRWPGRLQRLLGDDWYIIEEGLGGRTTVFDNPVEPHRSGIEALPGALITHRPLDYVILSLGTNDMKAMFHADERVIAAGLDMLVHEVKITDNRGAPTPRIVVVSPIYLRPDISGSGFIGFEESAVELSHKLAREYRRVAEQQGCLFLDAAQITEASDLDKLHMDGDNHAKFADAMAALLRDDWVARH
ncbi:SGNH/GDSL hydrolase family protein [Bifidobacterium biavatii]|uniref:G-D-S-L family lipolytic protein n=1 Tax=Bifidobacterium biavatii DSM 23969 TaxID=1437608 RepID=A0A086ZSL4_9BIFI|nr:SGNH/GDSL hydrolase family protein [Bifidobacterium biavatii]KFI49514.1 G-D-S-L family lipolytic protein [Bifidobacterium biavatii DSM 23969]